MTFLVDEKYWLPLISNIGYVLELVVFVKVYNILIYLERASFFFDREMTFDIRVFYYKSLE